MVDNGRHAYKNITYVSVHMTVQDNVRWERRFVFHLSCCCWWRAARC